MTTFAPPVSSTPARRSRLGARYERYDPSRVVGEMTVEEYFEWTAAAERRYDYVYRKVVQVAGASLEHCEITSNLHYRLRDAIRAAGARAHVYGSDLRLYTNRNVYRYPDLMSTDGAPQVGPNQELRNPAVIVEVLSESTQEDDRTDKFTEYQQIPSLRYYVLVEQYRVRVTVYGKQDSGLWAIVGDHANLSDTLSLTLGGKQIAVRLADIYEAVFDADDTTQP